MLIANGPWYKDGLRFECTQCGACCQADGVVHLTQDDLLRLTALLFPDMVDDGTAGRWLVKRPSKRDVEAVEACAMTYTTGGAGRTLLRTGNRCALQADDGKCKAQAAKPTQCRTFPFWELTVDCPDAWAALAQICPGVNQGRLYKAHEIEQRVAEAKRMGVALRHER